MKSCPFCGFVDVEVVSEQAYYNLPYYSYVKCHECGACGPRGNNEEMAIKRWENRQ